MRRLIFFLMIIILVPQISCSRKDRENVVDIDQLNEDGSTRDRYIFRDQIRDEKEQKKKELQEEFR